MLERVQVRRRVFERWDPRRLPAVRDPRVISRFTSISEIVWGSLFLLWWVGVLHFPTFSDDAGQAVLLIWTASFQSFYLPVLLLYVATTALAIQERRVWRAQRPRRKRTEGVESIPVRAAYRGSWGPLARSRKAAASPGPLDEGRRRLDGRLRVKPAAGRRGQGDRQHEDVARHGSAGSKHHTQ